MLSKFSISNKFPVPGLPTTAFITVIVPSIGALI